MHGKTNAHLCGQQYLPDPRDSIKSGSDKVHAEFSSLSERRKSGLGRVHVHGALESEVGGLNCSVILLRL